MLSLQDKDNSSSSVTRTVEETGLQYSGPVSMPQAKLTAFLSKQTSPKQKKASSQSGRPRQARLGDMPGVVRLPKMSGHATEAELQRLLSQLDQSSSDDALVQTLKQLACYEVTVDQVSPHNSPTRICIQQFGSRLPLVCLVGTACSSSFHRPIQHYATAASCMCTLLAQEQLRVTA